MIDSIVPMMLILVATKLCASDSWALGNIVNKATRKVPTIAITLGSKFLAFSTGSSLIKNKIVIKNMKPTVDTRELTSTMKVHVVGWFSKR